MPWPGEAPAPAKGTANPAFQQSALVTTDRLGVSYRQGGQTLAALHDVSLVLHRHERVAILGPSGCGKSSLLRVLAGLLDPTQGSVAMDGCAPGQFRDQHGIGFCFQAPVMLPWRTLLQNVLLPAELRHDSREAVSRHAEALISMVGLNGFENALPQQLSGGMQQRANLVRALILRPQLLLLDEAFSGIDELSREALWIDLDRIWQQEQTTLCLVTHSIREAVFLAQRVLVFSARPGTIRHDIPISLPEHRNQAVLSSSAFHALCDEVRAALL